MAIFGVPVWVVLAGCAIAAVAKFFKKGKIQDLRDRLGLSLSDGSLQCYGRLTEGLGAIHGFPWLNAAFNLGVFDLLQKPHTAKQVVEATKVKGAWPMEVLLEVMVDSGVFLKKPEGEEVVYWHTLTPPAIAEIRAQTAMLNLCYYRQLYFLTESIKTGEAVGLQQVFPGAKDLNHAMELNPEVKKIFTPWQNKMTRIFIGGLCAEVDFSRYSNVLDFLGGLTEGQAAIELCKRYPNVKTTVLDKKENLTEVAQGCKAAGVDAERVKTLSADLSASSMELPESYDCVLMAQLNHLREKDILRYFAAIKKALRPGGQLIMVAPLDGPHNTKKGIMQWSSAAARFYCCSDAETKVQQLDDIRRLLEIAGFTAIDHFLCPAPTPSPPTVVRAS